MLLDPITTRRISLISLCLVLEFAGVSKGQTPATNAQPTPQAPPTSPAVSTLPAPQSNTVVAPVEKMPKTSSPPDAVAASAIILGYHQFTPAGQHSKNIYSMDAGAFEQEMQYLKDNGCNVVPLSDVVAYVEGKGKLPPHAVAITIDDGYKSPLLYAAPILKKYGYPWTFFCYTDFITSHESKGASSWNDLIELGKEGIDVECHSKSHPFLSHKNGKTPEEYDQWLTAETAGAKATLEAHLHKTIKYFAYPYGDYNKQVQDKLIASGYEAIFTVAGNPVHATTSQYRMGRYVITSPEEKDFAAYLRQGALTIMAATPEPGATITDPRPIISAVLNYHGTLDPKSIQAVVKGYGMVPTDFDDKTSTVRLYLQRDLIQPVVNVSIRVKDPQANQTLVNNWQFNYQMTNTPAAPPISSSATAPVKRKI
jgi:peptidoglycan/xylan/chitin deacetylase (PgdA/CDA1 family)